MALSCVLLGIGLMVRSTSLKAVVITERNVFTLNMMPSSVEEALKTYFEQPNVPSEQHVEGDGVHLPGGLHLERLL